MRAWIAAVVIGIALAVFTVLAWPPRDELEPRVVQGNAAFEHREFPQALGHYESAPGDGPRNAGVHANRGLAKFRTLLAPGDASVLPELTADAAVPEGYSNAQDELRSAARGASNVTMEDIDAQVRARAQYNLGNTYFSEHSWRNAMDAYKEALRLRPGWLEAAWNLDLARRRKDEEDHPDAGPDAGQDAASDAANDAPSDAPRDGSGGDGGGNGDGGNQQGDSGSQQDRDSGAEGDSGGGNGQPDSGSPPPEQADAAAPQSLAPLDQLERNAQDLQQMMLRRRAAQSPRNPDDER